MRRQYERTHRRELIGQAGERLIADALRPRPRFVPRFIWDLFLLIVFKV